MLTNREETVYWDGYKSNTMPINSSIAQGGNSSTLFGCMYLYDFGETEDGQKLEEGVLRSGFVDDNVLVIQIDPNQEGVEAAQRALTQVYKYMQEKRLTLHAKTFQVLKFKNSHIQDIDIELRDPNSELLQISETTKILGVLIRDYLKVKDFLEFQINHTRGRFSIYLEI